MWMLWIDFWHAGTRETFVKVVWKDPCTGLWKRPTCFDIGSRACLCFLRGRKWSLMAPWTFDVCRTEYQLWGYCGCWCSPREVRVRFAESMFLTLWVIILQSEKGRRLWWQLTISRFLVDLLYKPLRPLWVNYSRSGQRMLTECLTVWLHHIFRCRG